MLLALLPIALTVGVVYYLMRDKSKVWGWVGGKPIEIDIAPIGNGQYLRRDAAQQFNFMADEAQADGLILNVESSFRTTEEQAALYARYLAGTGNLAAPPGFSNHQSGVAVDITVNRSFTSRTYLWLASHAQFYGFVNTGAFFTQKEPHHWEFKP